MRTGIQIDGVEKVYISEFRPFLTHGMDNTGWFEISFTDSDGCRVTVNASTSNPDLFKDQTHD